MTPITMLKIISEPIMANTDQVLYLYNHIRKIIDIMTTYKIQNQTNLFISPNYHL